ARTKREISPAAAGLHPIPPIERAGWNPDLSSRTVGQEGRGARRPTTILDLRPVHLLPQCKRACGCQRRQHVLPAEHQCVAIWGVALVADGPGRPRSCVLCTVTERVFLLPIESGGHNKHLPELSWRNGFQELLLG